MRNKTCEPDNDFVRAIESMVSDTVVYFRNRGHRRDVAIEQAALALGLTSRRVWSFYYEQPVAALYDEYHAIRRAFVQHLDQQADDLARRSEAARARRRQMEMEI